MPPFGELQDFLDIMIRRFSHKRIGSRLRLSTTGYVAAALAQCALSPSPSAQARSPVISLLEIRQRNVVIQQWDLSCGAAALATLLKYQHGVEVSERDIAAALIERGKYRNDPQLLKINQGFSLLDLQRFAEALGFEANGYGHLTPNDLLEMAPVLVPVSFDGYNHFAVFRGVAGGRVLLADPAWGNRTMSRAAFESAWIEFSDLGRVGLTVDSAHADPATNRLKPTELDFVMLR